MARHARRACTDATPGREPGAVPVAAGVFHLLPYALRRARFRELRARDLDAFHAYRRDPEVARFQGWPVITREEAAAFLDGHAATTHMTPGAWHQIAIAALHDDALIGDAGLWLSADGATAEFGLSITPARQGNGYGSECVRGLIELIFAGTTAREIVATADVRNLRCLAALERAGMKLCEVRRAEYKAEMCTEHVFLLRKPATAHA